MKFELNEYYIDITNEDLLNDLKSVAQTLDKNSVAKREYDEHGKYNSSTIQRRFGSWFEALSFAKLDKRVLILTSLMKKCLKTWQKYGSS